MIPRVDLLASVRLALGRSRAVVLIGPRQSGKSTLARQFLDFGDPRYFDLEDPRHAQRLHEPLTALEPLGGAGGPIVIDAVQRAPGLFPVLRVLIDRDERNGQFLLLGSASPTLLRQTSESLLGRVEVVEVAGFDLDEAGPTALTRLWLRGGYPRAFLAATDADSLVWRTQAINRHVESDLPQLGVNVPAPALCHRAAASPGRARCRLLLGYPQWCRTRPAAVQGCASGGRGVQACRCTQGYTQHLRIAIDDLKLDRLYVVYPGTQRYRLDEGIEVVPLEALLP